MSNAAIELFEKHKKELDEFQSWIRSQSRLPQHIGKVKQNAIDSVHTS